MLGEEVSVVDLTFIVRCDKQSAGISVTSPYAVS